MKNLYFSLIILSLLSPLFVFGQSQEETVQNFIQDAINNPTTATSSSNPDLINAFLPGTQTTTYPNLSPEENLFMQRRTGETASDYVTRIMIENNRRQEAGETLLPSPTSPTTQIPTNNGNNTTPLDSPRPSFEILKDPFTLPVTQTGQTPRTTGSGNILDSIVPQFGEQGLSGVLNQIFYAGLIIAVVLAIVTIIRGGVEYMTIDAASNKESAKNRIKAAIGGLILCFSTIVILNTINPGLTKLNINFDRIQNLSGVGVSGGIQIVSEARRAREDFENNFVGPPVPGEPGTNTAGPIPTSYFGGPSDVRTKGGLALHYCDRLMQYARVGEYAESTNIGGSEYRWCYALDSAGNKIPYNQGRASAHGGYFEPTSFGASPLMRELSGDYIAYPLNNTAASRLTGLPSVSSNSQLSGRSVELTLVNGTKITAQIRDRGPHGSIGKLDVSPALSQKISAGGGLQSVRLQ